MSQRKVLLFPANLLEAMPIKAMAEQAGEYMIAASSLADEPALPMFREHVVLRHILDPQFAADLLRLLGEKDIKHIYAPHPWCYSHIKQLLQGWGSPVTLSHGLPQFHAATIVADYETAVRQVLPRFTHMRTQQIPLPPHSIAAFLQLAARIEGQSHFAKLAALCYVAADFPAGDVVEVGVGNGRSAVLLALLARHFRVGPLLCIDPWREAAAQQGVAILDAELSTRNESWDACYRNFVMTMQPFAAHHVACLRLSSQAAHEIYCRRRTVGEAPLGPILTGGKIAALHVDGNHTYDAARWDIFEWGGLVIAGGWLIIDDYEWPYGDGPKRAANEWVAANQQRIAEKFVCGGAMFIKLYP